jgi:hypothetical protein
MIDIVFYYNKHFSQFLNSVCFKDEKYLFSLECNECIIIIIINNESFLVQHEDKFVASIIDSALLQHTLITCSLLAP